MREFVARRMFAWMILGILGLVAFPSVSNAATMVRYARRGVQLDLYIDPGDTYVVYYYVDGRPATMSYRRSWITDPYTIMDVHVKGVYGWYPMYLNQLVEPFRWKYVWFGIFRGATYRMIISNKRASSLVHLRIQ